MVFYPRSRGFSLFGFSHQAATPDALKRKCEKPHGTGLEDNDGYPRLVVHVIESPAIVAAY
jgi:hypothetical protein